MSLRRSWAVLWKDLRVGPRSPLVLYAIVFPIAATLLIQLVFGSLFEPTPRLGIVDRGDSAVTRAALAREDIETSVVSSTSRLQDSLEANDIDAGIVLPPQFDQRLRAGEYPEIRLYVSGESLASSRAILMSVVAGLIRDVAGQPAPIDVEVVTIGGDEYLPLSERLVPLLVLFAMLIAGMFVPAAALVEEKEKGTLSAVLVSPARITEVMAAKGALGITLAVSTGMITLALNRAFGDHPLALVVILVIAALMVLLMGLVVGALVKDTNTMFTVFKTGNILLVAPVIFYVWPELPQWIAKLFPTYYFLDPIYRVAVEGEGIAEVWGHLAIALVICALLVPMVALAGRRMERRLASS